MLAFLNVRLGYWWDSGIEPGGRTKRCTAGMWVNLMARASRMFSWAFRVQSYLLYEFLGRFHGPGRRYWYLTDGGHFENTGVYELVRRRLPLIICIDNGADPDYQFEDLGNLVRHARTDFGAEIRFLNPENRKNLLDLAKGGPGLTKKLMEQVRQQVAEGSCCDAAEKVCANQAVPKSGKCHLYIGHIAYKSSGKSGLLLWVKPAVTGDEDCDIIEYAATHDSFPQESTANQFFDEAQWESYRRLGEHSGKRLADVLKGLLPAQSKGNSPLRID
jgi:hypothetical protein